MGGMVGSDGIRRDVLFLETLVLAPIFPQKAASTSLRSWCCFFGDAHRRPFRHARPLSTDSPGSIALGRRDLAPGRRLRPRSPAGIRAGRAAPAGRVLYLRPGGTVAGGAGTRT